MAGALAPPLFEAMFHVCPEPLLAVDDGARVLRANVAAAQLLGVSPDALVGMDVRTLSTWSANEFEGGWGGLLRAGGGGATVGMRTPGGERLQVTAAAVRVEPGVLLISLHPEAGNATLSAAREMEARLRAILDHAPMVLFAVDAQGNFTFSDGPPLRRVGLKAGEVVGRSARETYRALELTGVDGRKRSGAEIVDAVLGGETFVGLSELNGTVFDNWFVPVRDPTGKVSGFVGVSTDVTERKVLEARLMAADRLASLGALAAGVAHELNNPLAFVSSNLGYALEELASLPSHPRLAEVTAALRETEEGAARMRVIVRDLKTFSHSGEEESGSVDLASVVESAAAMTGSQIRPRGRLVLELGTGLPPVRGNAPRLGQVFTNLLVNAAQALPEGAASQHVVAVRLRREGDRVVAEVSDTGSGIPEALRSRIFDPFFTTKPVGVGTGLGLSICQAILARFGGAITVQSELGRGSTFRVTLPVDPAFAGSTGH